MNITAAAVIRMANALPEVRKQMIDQATHPELIIQKAKELQTGAAVDKEQDENLDELIAELSLPAANKKNPEAVTLIK